MASVPGPAESPQRQTRETEREGKAAWETRVQAQSQLRDCDFTAVALGFLYTVGGVVISFAHGAQAAGKRRRRQAAVPFKGYGSGGRAAASAAAPAALPPLKRQRGLCLPLPYACRHYKVPVKRFLIIFSFVHISSTSSSFFIVNIIFRSSHYIFIGFAAAALLPQQEQRRPYLLFFQSPLLLLKQQKQRQHEIRLLPSSSPSPSSQPLPSPRPPLRRPRPAWSGRGR